jgi:hypothetical protein
VRYYGVPGLGKVRARADIRGRVVNGQVRMHAFVRYPDGSVEDPSTKLGMPGGGAEQWEREAPPKMVAAVQRAARLAGAGGARPPASRRELAQRIPRALLLRAIAQRYGREVA